MYTYYSIYNISKMTALIQNSILNINRILKEYDYYLYCILKTIFFYLKKVMKVIIYIFNIK